MGGGGNYYDRDVTFQGLRTSSGASSVAERELSQRSMDPKLLPLNRRLVCKARNPLVYDFDVTGSMGTLPKIIYDKWPGIVGQIVARKYLPEPEMSITATGDIRSDSSPLQMCDFSALRNLDRWLKRIHFEGNGGGQGSESYEMTAYYYARFCDMPNAENPIYLMTGDEACPEELYAGDLAEHFGGEHRNIAAKAVFAELVTKYKGNVFRIQKRYSGTGRDGWNQSKIAAQWNKFIGEERVIHLSEDLAIGDITLGVYAVVSGARTLKEYLEDMGNRELTLGADVKYEPQSAERIRQVEEALQPLKNFKPVQSRPTISTSKPGVAMPADSKDAATKKKDWKF